jgi:hypothetical protein
MLGFGEWLMKMVVVVWVALGVKLFWRLEFAWRVDW